QRFRQEYRGALVVSGDRSVGLPKEVVDHVADLLAVVRIALQEQDEGLDGAVDLFAGLERLEVHVGVDDAHPAEDALLERDVLLAPRHHREASWQAHQASGTIRRSGITGARGDINYGQI